MMKRLWFVSLCGVIALLIHAQVFGAGFFPLQANPGGGYPTSPTFVHVGANSQTTTDNSSGNYTADLVRWRDAYINRNIIGNGGAITGYYAGALTIYGGAAIDNLFDGSYAVTPKVADHISGGPRVDVRRFMDGQPGRPTLATWVSNPSGTYLDNVILAADATGLPVFFPKGTFKITTGLSSNTPNEWEGVGEGSILQANAASFDLLTLGTGATGKKIRNLQFLGAATNNSTVQYGIFTSSSPDRVEISGCYFDNTNSAIKNINGKYWNIHNNTFNNLIGAISGTGYGYLSGDGANYNNIESNTFIGSSGNGRHAVYLSAGASYNTAKNNRVIGFNELAFSIYATDVQSTAFNNSIDSNKVFGGGTTGTAESAAIGIACNAKGNSIRNNEIFNFKNVGIIANDFGCGGLVNGNTIAWNTIDNSYYFGIQLIGTKNTRVLGNDVSNSSSEGTHTYSGIGLFGSGTGGAQVNDNALIVGNSSFGLGQRSAFAINSGAPVSTNTYISGNTFLSPAWAPGFAYDIPAAATVKMFGNITDQNFTNGSPATDEISLHLSRSISIDFPNILANTSSDNTITLTGVDNTWSVIATPQGSPEAGLTINAWASAPNTITIRASNVTTGAINPAERPYRFDAWKH